MQGFLVDRIETKQKNNSRLLHANPEHIARQQSAMEKYVKGKDIVVWLVPEEWEQKISLTLPIHPVSL